MPRGEGKTTGGLTGACASSDERAMGLDSVEAARFDAVVRRSAGRLIHMLDAAFLDRELSKDAAQDAFVQLYLHWDKVGTSAEPEAWLYRVAVNRCRDHRRRVVRAGSLLWRLVSVADAPPTDHLEAAGNFFHLLRTLPQKQRTSAALFYEGDMSITDIAGTMGISEGAVNSHLNRARSKPRELLQER
jgi:RNA polymerase sigma factor (sigma-70 family)